LATEEFIAIRNELARPLGIGTLGVAQGEVLAAICERTGHRLSGSGLASPAFRRDPPAEGELRRLTCGAALAYVLRGAGLAVEPRRMPNGEVELTVVALAAAKHAWPVGEAVTANPKEVLPALFEFLNAEIDGVPLVEVLPALEERLGA